MLATGGGVYIESEALSQIPPTVHTKTPPAKSPTEPRAGTSNFWRHTVARLSDTRPSATIPPNKMDKYTTTPRIEEYR